MIVEHEQRGAVAAEALAALAHAVGAAAACASAAEALRALAEGARAASGAEVAVIRVCELGGERLEAVAVAAPAALAAELEGTHLPAGEVPAATVVDLAEAPPAVRQAALRAGAGAVLVVPVPGGATLELYRAGRSFSFAERLAAELAGAQASLLLRAFSIGPSAEAQPLARPALELAGEALAASLDGEHTAAEVVRVAASVVGAPVGLLWVDGAEGLELAASFGLASASVDVAPARDLARAALEEPGPVRAVPAERLPGTCGISTTLPLGQPPVGLLQLLFARGEAPTVEQLARLTTFGVRAAHALRAGARAQTLSAELDRTRALLAVVGQAMSELSLTHTLDTAADSVARLFGADRVGVYLRGDDDQLATAAVRLLSGPHLEVAERLLDLALGTGGRAVLEIASAGEDPGLEDVRAQVWEAGIESVLAAPLLVRREVIGLLAVYGPRDRAVTDNERSLMTALSSQLAVAVQNAQLHERATQLGKQRESALASERAAARRLRALYEISRSFAQSLSLDATLDALAQTVVDVLDVDAAVIRIPDARREQLVPRAIHVEDQLLEAAARAILFRPQPFGLASVQRLFRERHPFRVVEHGDGPLAPFLEKGWTAVAVPIATPGEVIASLELYCFRPGSPIGDDTIEAATTIAGQAALAVDNARLYQQQKEFADTMQRSLLPSERPDAPGLEVGEVYESSARVDVGGDIYDFLELDGGRLAVVLGDVTGHGVEATADMAMAKFVFRSLAREHPEPGAFLAAANEVVVDEIAPGKFITMAYLTVDGVRGEVAAASAGHPAPRLVLPDGEVRGLEANGLVLGIDGGQVYDEVHAEVPEGALIVLFTDGVIEARRDGELYGMERLDALLAEHRALPAAALARVVTEDCRRFADGELTDDVAVVVIRRTT